MMMFGHHVTQHLSAYLHRELAPELNSRVEDHLRECPRCRADYDEIRFGAQMASLLAPSSAPESIWSEIHRRDSRKAYGLPQIAAGVAALVVVATFSWLLARSAPENRLNRASTADSWEVESLRGTPRIQDAAVSGAAELRVGETLQTDESSQAEVRIASIGKLTVDPNTRLRLIITKSDEHRIALDHGKVEAITWAPPRLFIVDTPSARAVDLGCIYTLDVQKDGSSLLHVTLGMVSLASHGRESFVPAYDFARSRPNFGPGTPFHEQSSERFKAALDVIDFGTDRSEASLQLGVILSEAQERDATTLWHLLSRVESGDRVRVYDRLARFIAPPAGVTRDGILALEAKMVRAWGEEVPELFWMKQSQ
jgi:hypothetical protein